MNTVSVRRPRKLRRSAIPWYAAVGGMFVLLCGLMVMTFRPVRVESSSTLPTRLVSEDDTVIVPVPARVVARGERLGSVPFDTVKWPKGSLGSNYLHSIAEYQDAVTLVSLPNHMPVPVSSVSLEPSDFNAVVEGIPSGLRAITVRVDAESAVEGWARSGNRVDVIVIQQSKNRDVGLEAKVIAENVRILSAGRSTEPLKGQPTVPRAPATVTLLVTQEDALKIKLAAGIGKITFALRGSKDTDPALSVAVNQRAMLGAARTFIPKKEKYRGRAKGPDGRVYFLAEDSQWIRAPGLDSSDSVEQQKGGNDVSSGDNEDSGKVE